MSTAGIFAYCAVVASMTVAAFYFGRRIRTPKIPMQWGFDGQPTWYAPKAIGLWTPICLVIVGGPLFLVAIGSPRAAVGLMVFSAIMAVTYSVYLAAVVRWASTTVLSRAGYNAMVKAY